MATKTIISKRPYFVKTLSGSTTVFPVSRMELDSQVFGRHNLPRHKYLYAFTECDPIQYWQKGMEAEVMRVRFWGTRGSIAKPGNTTRRYGGNTSCVEVQAADGTLVVLDCGTGAHGLGRALVQASEGALRGHLFIGHTHWDHIQGFPFFEPLFIPGNVWDVYAPGSHSGHLKAIFARQMSYEYSPIALDALNAEVRFHDLRESVFEIGSIRVTTQYLNHPALTLGYRLEADGATLVYATDHEPFSLHPCDAPPGTALIHREDKRHIQLLDGADLVIHDAQYSRSDFPAKVGWGHTPIERAVDYAVHAQVRQLALFHHDPQRHDEAIDQLCQSARTRAASCGDAPHVFAAAEGQVIDLTPGLPRPRPSRVVAPARLASSQPGPATVLIADEDPDIRRLLEATLHAEGVHALMASDGQSTLRLARQECPALILLDTTLPGLDGLSVCRKLRAEADAQLRDVPVVMMTGVKLKETDLVEAFAAGATDYLAKPVKPTLLRARICAWLLRTRVV